MTNLAKPKSVLRKLALSLRAARERHEERHRPSGFAFAFADRVDFLDRQRWDEVTASNSLFLRRDVLRVIEQYGPENILPRYAMIFRGDKPVAALTAQIVGVTGDRLGRNAKLPRSDRSPTLLHRAFSPAARAASANLRHRLIVTG